MADVLEILKSVAPLWKLIALALVVAGIYFAYWKTDIDLQKMIRRTATDHSASFQDVVLTEILRAASRTQKLTLVLVVILIILVLLLE